MSRYTFVKTPFHNRNAVIAGAVAVILLFVGVIFMPTTTFCISNCYAKRLALCLDKADSQCILATLLRAMARGDDTESPVNTDELTDTIVSLNEEEEMFATLATLERKGLLSNRYAVGNLLSEIALNYVEHDDGNRLGVLVTNSDKLGVSLELKRSIKVNTLMKHKLQELKLVSISAVQSEEGADDRPGLLGKTYLKADRLPFSVANGGDILDEQLYFSPLFLGGDISFLTDDECRGGRSNRLIGYGLSAAGAKEVDEIQSLAVVKVVEAIKLATSQVDFAGQIITLATIPPQNLRGNADFHNTLVNSGERLKVDLVDTFKKLRVRGSSGRSGFDFDRRFDFDPENSKATDASIDLSLLTNWLVLSLDTGEGGDVDQTVIDTFQLIFSRQEDSIRQFAIPLAYALALNGKYGLPLAALRGLSYREVGLKSQIVACTINGLIDRRDYAEAIAIIKALSPPSIPADAVKTNPNKCDWRFVYDETCQAINILREKDHFSTIFLHGGGELERNANRFYWHALDLLCARLAVDTALSAHRAEIITYLEEQLGKDAAILTKVYIEMGAGDIDNSRYDEYTKASTGKVVPLISVLVNYKTLLSVRERSYKEAFEAAVSDPLSSFEFGRDVYGGGFPVPVRDSQLMIGITDGIIAAGDADWLVSAVEKKEAAGVSGLSSAALLSISQKLFGIERVDLAVRLYRATKQADQLALLISELRKRKLNEQLTALYWESRNVSEFALAASSAFSHTKASNTHANG